MKQRRVERVIHMKPSYIYDSFIKLSHFILIFLKKQLCVKLCNGKGQQNKNYTACITFQLLSFSMSGLREGSFIMLI